MMTLIENPYHTYGCMFGAATVNEGSEREAEEFADFEENNECRFCSTPIEREWNEFAQDDDICETCLIVHFDADGEEI